MTPEDSQLLAAVPDLRRLLEEAVRLVAMWKHSSQLELEERARVHVFLRQATALLATLP